MSETLIENLRLHLGKRPRETMHFEGFRSAAVLVPLLQSKNGFEILFTVRSSKLNNHAGQVAFPGGRLDEGETIETAALRETLEETGLNVTEHNILGQLDDMLSPAKYMVTPVLALADWPQDLTLSPEEVDDVFTVPLKHLLNIKPYTEIRQLEGKARYLYFYPWQERLIWGLTGNVLKNFLDVYQNVTSKDS